MGGVQSRSKLLWRTRLSEACNYPLLPATTVSNPALASRKNCRELGAPFAGLELCWPQHKLSMRVAEIQSLDVDHSGVHFQNIWIWIGFESASYYCNAYSRELPLEFESTASHINKQICWKNSRSLLLGMNVFDPNQFQEFCMEQISVMQTTISVTLYMCPFCFLEVECQVTTIGNLYPLHLILLWITQGKKTFK